MTQSQTKPRVPEEAGTGSRPPAGRSWLDRYFHISARGSTLARELRGGLTTFMAMAYILLLNPLILSGPDAAGHTLPRADLITATALAAAVSTLLMGLVGRVPLVLAAGLSVSGVLAAQAVPQMTWGQAFVMCLAYGAVICLLVVTGLRELIMNAIPPALKHGITIGIGSEANLTDDKGRMPGLSKALFIDGAGGVIGGVAGASGQTVFVESATGVGEGARTGLSSVVTGLLFACGLFFTPLAQIVPGQVAAAALVVIGAMMMQNARHVDWSDRSVTIPVFLTVALMPFTYSITTGVGAGVIAYTAIKVAQGRTREPGAFMYALTVVFLVYFSLHPIENWLGVR
jgi:xanthine/uracil/vitamin C permease (AzgA family)